MMRHEAEGRSHGPKCFYIRLVARIMVTISGLIYVQIDKNGLGLSKEVLVRGVLIHEAGCTCLYEHAT